MLFFAIRAQSNAVSQSQLLLVLTFIMISVSVWLCCSISSSLHRLNAAVVFISVLKFSAIFHLIIVELPHIVNKQFQRWTMHIYPDMHKVFHYFRGLLCGQNAACTKPCEQVNNVETQLVQVHADLLPQFHCTEMPVIGQQQALVWSYCISDMFHIH